MEKKSGIREQKQEVVREALFGAAVELFATKGFEETTVDEVAQAAGLSRSTFFRLFDSKDDLLTYPMVNYAAVLMGAIRACPPGSSEFDVLENTVLAGIAFTLHTEVRTKQVIDIAGRSTTARQAYLSRTMDLEARLLEAYGERFLHPASGMRPRLLASLTLTILNTSFWAWSCDAESNLQDVAIKVINELRSISSDGR